MKGVLHCKHTVTWTKIFYVKTLTVFSNMAVLVKGKEQFWDRTCHFGMCSKQQSDFQNSIVTNLPLTRPQTPHLLVQNSKGNSKRMPGGWWWGSSAAPHFPHKKLYTPEHQHLPEQDSRNNSTDVEWFAFSPSQALKNSSYTLTTNLALLQALSFSSSSNVLKFSF